MEAQKLTMFDALTKPSREGLCVEPFNLQCPAPCGAFSWHPRVASSPPAAIHLPARPAVGSGFRKAPCGRIAVARFTPFKGGPETLSDLAAETGATAVSVPEAVSG
jgi:hypothetical protein